MSVCSSRLVTPAGRGRGEVLALSRSSHRTPQPREGTHRRSVYPAVMIHEPAVLIEGVLFRARYLGSTQLVSEGQPTKTTRMMQAEEAVSRIKVGVAGRGWR